LAFDKGRDRLYRQRARRGRSRQAYQGVVNAFKPAADSNRIASASGKLVRPADVSRAYWAEVDLSLTIGDTTLSIF
jgi:hypothetical protein